MKINILHDWIYEYQKKEHILKQFNQLYPNAQNYTFHLDNEVFEKNFQSYCPIISHKLKYDKKTIWKHIGKFPNELKKFIDKKNILDCELIITNSKGPMRWIKTSPNKNNSQSQPIHVAYLYEPYPYIYLDWEQLKDSHKLGTFWDKFSQEDQSEYKKLDMLYAQGIDIAITHSNAMKTKLDTLYGINCHVCPPPIDDNIFQPIKSNTQDYYLLISNIEAKRSIETIIHTFNYLKDKLLIVGDGPYLETLQKELIRNNITFLPAQNETQLAELISQSKAIIVADNHHISCAGHMACKMGKPIITHNQSAIAEFIIPNETGIIYSQDNEDGFLPAIYQFEKMKFNKDKAIQIGKQFSNENFKKQIEEIISTNL